MGRDIRIRIAVVISRGDEILLVRHVKGDRQYWLVPGGGLDWGESIEDCAIREIKEETNLDIKLIKLLFISESLSREYERHLVNLTFLGQITGGIDDVQVVNDERIKEARFFPIADLGRIELHPPIAPFIVRAYRESFHGNAQFLGNLWTYSF